MSSAEHSCKLFKPIFAYRQTMWTLIRLLLEEQSDLGPHCLQKWILKSQAEVKADDSCCDWQFKGWTHLKVWKWCFMVTGHREMRNNILLDTTLISISEKKKRCLFDITVNDMLWSSFHKWELSLSKGLIVMITLCYRICSETNEGNDMHIGFCSWKDGYLLWE